MLLLLAFLRRVYDYFQRHYVVSAALATLPAHWFLLLKVKGASLGLVATGGQLTRGADAGFWACLILSVGFALLKAVGDRQNEEAKENGQFLLAKVLGKIRLVNRKKFNRYDAYAQMHHDRGGRSAIGDAMEPKEQIAALLEELQDVIADICDVPQENTAVSLIFKFDSEEKWRWLHSVNVSDDLDLDTLTKDAKTTFRELVESKRKTVFHADKRRAEAAGHYLPGKRDSASGTVGSIYCRDISIGSDKRYAHAVLSVSTFGNQLCEEGDQESVERIDTIMMPVFEEGLRYELCMLYLKWQSGQWGPGKGQRPRKRMRESSS